jgi:hypothetical protein
MLFAEDVEAYMRQLLDGEDTRARGELLRDLAAGGTLIEKRRGDV